MSIDNFNMHVPIELSRVLAGFLAASETNSLTVKVCGKRKREVGLVAPGCYRARTNRKKVADILSQEIKKIKERYPYFRTRHRTRCCSQAIVGQTRRKLNKLRDFLRVFFIFEAILGGWCGVGEGGASIRQGAFIREGRLIQTIHLKGGVY